MRRLALLAVLAASSSFAQVTAPRYAVLVEQGASPGFHAAGAALARHHGTTVTTWDGRASDRTLAKLRELAPRDVAFVVAPGTLDIDLSRSLLSLATRLDDDPFTDFTFGFITGRDGAAAGRFVERIIAAHACDFGRKGHMIGSWEGLRVPRTKNTACQALSLDMRQGFVLTRSKEEERAEKMKATLGAVAGSDLVVMFSHGYPDRATSCFEATDLGAWKVDLAPAVVFNCCCYNGVTGRWFEIGPGGAYRAREAVKPAESMALAMIDAGVSGYVAGLDTWHAWLTNQAFLHAVDDGLSLGEATKMMWDRLALEFAPDRIGYAPAIEHAFTGEGTDHRRRQGSAMVLFGDPALAPWRDNASRLTETAITQDPKNGSRITIRTKPYVGRGWPGADYMLPQSRYMDYYSVKTDDVQNELSMELYRVVDLPAGAPVEGWKVVSATAGGRAVGCRQVQTAVEDRHGEKRLHVRVPLDVRAVGLGLGRKIIGQGIEVVLEP